MKRVLIIGPDFHYFMQSIGRAFSALGYDVKIEAYQDPIHPYNLLNKIRYKIAKKKSPLKEQSAQNWKNYIERCWREMQPDIVFIVNGNNLTTESTALFASKSTVILWLFDSISRFPELKKNVPFAHHIFCYEKEDIDYLKQQNIEAHFLPQAVDETLYHPIECEKDIDICFAGDIYSSKKRRAYLDAVIQTFNSKKIVFYGIANPWYKGIYQWLTRPNRNIYKNKNISATELNLLYNRSKVVLNIHNEQQKNGANPKVYEIAASGAYQICDSNEYIRTLFDSNQIGLYGSIEEMLALINEGLQNGEHHSAAKQTLENHTFTIRIKQMLDICSSK